MNLTSGCCFSYFQHLCFYLHCWSQAAVWSAHNPQLGDQGSELAVLCEISCKWRRRRCLISQQSSNLKMEGRATPAPLYGCVIEGVTNLLLFGSTRMQKIGYFLFKLPFWGTFSRPLQLCRPGVAAQIATTISATRAVCDGFLECHWGAAYSILSPQTDFRVLSCSSSRVTD